MGKRGTEPWVTSLSNGGEGGGDGPFEALEVTLFRKPRRPPVFFNDIVDGGEWNRGRGRLF